MGFQDRHYYRDSDSGASNPLTWLLTGSIPLFTAFGIRVRAHALFLLFILLVLLFGLGRGSTVEMRVQSMTILFGIVLLHEFGHCFAARWTGGDAHEIMMTPLGGLAMTMSRFNWWSRFVTVAGGPLVNVGLCLICGIVFFFLTGVIPLTPGALARAVPREGWFEFYNYLYWIFAVSYVLLLFNLLPIFPLDGGQLVQSILWKYVGHYRSMMLMVNIGMVGSIILGMVGIATIGAMGGGLFLTLIAVFCFMNCLNTRRMLVAAGPYEMEDSTDYSAAYETFSPKPRRRNKWAAKRALKLARQEMEERDRIDRILAKVSAQGMHSLTWFERRALKKATEHQRQRDEELSRIRGE